MKKIRNWLDTHEKEYAENEITFLESLCESIVDDSFSATLARLIGLFIHSTTLITRNTALGEKTNRYKFDILVEGESRRLCEMLKSLAIGLVFHTPQVHQLEYKGGRILRKLFSVMEEEYMKDGTHPFRLLPAHYHEAMATSSHLQKKRMLCDYLSGMTDGFVVRTYKRLFDPDFGSIIDLI